MIHLEGYQTVERNKVYARDNLIHQKLDGLPVKEVLLLKRFTKPEDKEVLENIRDKGEHVQYLIKHCNNRLIFREDQKLEKLIASLDEDARFSLINWINYTFNSGEIKTDIYSLPKPYLFARYGIIPLVDFDENKNYESFSEQFIDPELEYEGFGQQYSVKLLHQGKLPDIKIIKSYIVDEVSRSNSLKVEGITYNQETIRKIIDAIYSGNFSQERFDLLEDCSAKILEGESLVNVQHHKRNFDEHFGEDLHVKEEKKTSQFN